MPSKASDVLLDEFAGVQLRHCANLSLANRADCLRGMSGTKRLKC